MSFENAWFEEDIASWVGTALISSRGFLLINEHNLVYQMYRLI